MAISVQKEYHVVVSKYWNMLFTLLLSLSYTCSVTIYTASIQSLIEVEQKGHACSLAIPSTKLIIIKSTYVQLDFFVTFGIVINLVNDILMVHLLNTSIVYTKNNY